jgi:alanyl-tRNA synthetase
MKKPMEAFVKVRLSSQQARLLERRASEDHVTVSHVVRAALRNFFAKDVSQVGKAGSR